MSEVRLCYLKFIFASAERIKEKTFRIAVHRYIKIFVLSVVVSVSLSLIEFCVLRITGIAPGKVL